MVDVARPELVAAVRHAHDQIRVGNRLSAAPRREAGNDPAARSMDCH